MKSFFSEEVVADLESTLGAAKCSKCGLSNRCYSPRMQPSGEGRKKILIVAEAPGEKEDERGTQLIGPAGQLLNSTLSQMGIDLHEDCRKINAVNCRPPKNRTPTHTEVECCRPMVWEELRQHPPHTIILLGNAAIASYFGHVLKCKPGGVNKWRGVIVPDHTNKTWVMGTFHPSYLLRNSTDKALNTIWVSDLQRALKNHASPLVFEDVEGRVRRLTSAEKTVQFLSWLKKKKPAAISLDWETTGKKPHAKGHRIVSGAIAWSRNHCVSFLMHPNIVPALRAVLTDPDIKIIAHNASFEMTWCKVTLGFWPLKVHWDTMLNAHLLDCREKSTGLKHQVYINYGVSDYDTMGPYKRGLLVKEQGANAFNRFAEEQTLEKIRWELLLYGGLDALYTWRLAEDQAKQFGDTRWLSRR